ncbi:MAG TPA: S1 RNA-binding domain-containing protein [Verrucomicrobiae bacterium]|nr:S1 RNA-binding domain-containing protein [Verrucomicrobiae bacterium]
MAKFGQRNILAIVRAAPPGLYLDGGALGEILLPGRYIPANLKPKDKLDVFIYRDSNGWTSISRWTKNPTGLWLRPGAADRGGARRWPTRSSKPWNARVDA